MNEPVSIIPFGDVHYGSNNCAKERWLEFLDGLKSKKNFWAIGMGDYFDALSASERAAVQNGALHDSTHLSLEVLIRKAVRDFCNEAKVLKNHCIGLLEGNHYYKFPNGTTTTQLMCEYFNCAYLGYSSFIVLVLRPLHRSKATNLPYRIWAHHGMGAAQLIGGSINKLEQMEKIAEADLYILGHDHQKACVPLPQKLCLVQSGNEYKLKERTRYGVRSGSFLRTYKPGSKSYGAIRGYRPSALGTVEMSLIIKRHKEGKVDRMWIEASGTN
jgi:UDP-2,3-diacylglucosamine pyrophosphatase LpxH